MLTSAAVSTKKYMPVGLCVMKKRRLGERPATLVATSDQPWRFPTRSKGVDSSVQHFQIVSDTNRADVDSEREMENGDVLGIGIVESV